MLAPCRPASCAAARRRPRARCRPAPRRSPTACRTARACYDAAGRRHQLPQHLELARRQLQRLGCARGRSGRALRSSMRAPTSQCRRCVGAAHQRAQPRLDLAQVERLAQVVVGAGVEAGDALVGAVARGQHQHRRAVAARARLAQRRPCQAAAGRAGSGRAARRRTAARATGGRRLAACAAVDAVAGVGQAAQHHVAQHGVVFDQQDSHGVGEVESRFVTVVGWSGGGQAAGGTTGAPRGNLRRDRPFAVIPYVSGGAPVPRIPPFETTDGDFMKIKSQRTSGRG